MIMNTTIALTILAVASAASLPSHVPSLSCHDLIIPVSVTASNLALPANLTLNTLSNLGQPIPTTTVSGTYNISARYCEPSTLLSGLHQTKPLQILIHGLTYTKDYWSGLAPPNTYPGQDIYSWVSYATRKGYPTLSIDRICNGISSHPDAISVCQIPIEVETIHSIVQSVRAGSIPDIKKAFRDIVLIGHSHGSQAINALSLAHPEDASAIILTGFSLNLTQAGSVFATNIQPVPARELFPQKYGSLGPAYLTPSNASGAEKSFYYGAFSPSFAAYDYSHRGIFTLGEVASSFLGQVLALQYTGGVFVLNGNEDSLFCQQSPEQAAAGAIANCSNGFSSEVRRGYPNAKEFGFHNTPLTGHCLNNHLTAVRSFDVAHDFLANVGL